MSRVRTVSIGIILVGVLALSLFLLAGRYNAGAAAQQNGAGQGSLTLDRAAGLADDYLVSLGNKDLAVDEIMEFEFNFYVLYYEKSTGMGAFEAIIDKAGTGGMMLMMGYRSVRPEQGPNMMWNTKYGMHSMMGEQSTLNNVLITESQARQYAQTYLDANSPGAVAEDVHPFYGYYTIHVIADSRVSGMLSVSGYSGQVWYHNWHGRYIQSLELRDR
jgi:hypothetical protein